MFMTTEANTWKVSRTHLFSRSEKKTYDLITKKSLIWPFLDVEKVNNRDIHTLFSKQNRYSLTPLFVYL